MACTCGASWATLAAAPDGELSGEPCRRLPLAKVLARPFDAYVMPLPAPAEGEQRLPGV